MDVVYLCRAGENEELRYSLRSLKNIPHDRVWVVGDKPAWCNTHIIRNRNMGNKHKTTSQHLEMACMDRRISNPFILFNDDFYVTEPTEIGHYNRGDVQDVLIDYLERFGQGTYITGMRDTYALLKRLGLPTLSYELHIPMIIHKEKMLEALELGKQITNLHKRTLYGNLINTDSIYRQDVKFRKQDTVIPSGEFLSSDDTTFPKLQPMLNDLFPDRSEYEL